VFALEDGVTGVSFIFVLPMLQSSNTWIGATQYSDATFYLGQTYGSEACLDLCAKNTRCMTVHYNTWKGACHAEPARREPTNKQGGGVVFMRA
jgi:hypothetical protein